MENSLERLRLQEVSQIILSVPEGVVITGTDIKPGEPILIINRPGTSNLNFRNGSKTNEAGSGFLSRSGTSKSIDFTINEGSVLYSVWSYLYGLTEESASVMLKGTEYKTLGDDSDTFELEATTLVNNLVVYKIENGLHKLTPGIDYTAYYEEIEDKKKYFVKLTETIDKNYFVCYDYMVEDVKKTTVKQVHNNILCALDMYFDAMDIDTEDKHTVCLHCDRVQIFTNLMIGINNNEKTSFTPIEIRSIPEGDNLIKDVATITVI